MTAALGLALKQAIEPIYPGRAEALGGTWQPMVQAGADMVQLDASQMQGAARAHTLATLPYLLPQSSLQIPGHGSSQSRLP